MHLLGYAEQLVYSAIQNFTAFNQCCTAVYKQTYWFDLLMK